MRLLYAPPTLGFPLRPATRSLLPGVRPPCIYAYVRAQICSLGPDTSLVVKKPSYTLGLRVAIGVLESEEERGVVSPLREFAVGDGSAPDAVFVAGVLFVCL